jgi:alkylation response protein AidB-like acyl-CoA dehydrogenase
VENGGSGWTLAETTAAVEALARASGSAALIAAMPMGLSGAYAIPEDAIPAEHRPGWHEQAERYAAAVSRGQLYAAANSERGAGGSLAATKTIATRSPGGAFTLTGDKILATGGANAAMFFSTAKVDPAELPGCGIVEMFFVPSVARGVEIKTDWNGFGMRSTESQSLHYEAAPAEGFVGYPDFLARAQPLPLWFTLFAAVPLGCAGAILGELGATPPQSPALRLRLSDGLMRYEAAKAYLLQVAGEWRPAAGPAYAARVLRAKTYVAQEMTRLAAELFALGGGSQYRRGGRAARALADSFAGTALRPPLVLALDTMLEQFDVAGPLENPPL